MTEPDGKADLRRYLQDAREALLWKLDGLSEYDQAWWQAHHARVERAAREAATGSS